MSSNEKKERTFYGATNLDPHETLYLESREDGTVGIKFYCYHTAINPESFATKLHLIEDTLNQNGYYVEGRTNKEGYKAVSEGEIKESAKGDIQITAKGNDMDTTIREFKKATKEVK
jgi:hypothetical protein